MTSSPALPHGPLTEVFPDVFFVTGTSRPRFMDLDWQFSRNMTVIREAGRLTLVNTVRLDDAGLAALGALGRVTDVVRLGAFHGIDDAFYVERYGARHWGLAGMPEQGGSVPSAVLGAGGEMPAVCTSLFTFETSRSPEALLSITREGGVLVSCDSLQNWVRADAYFDAASAERMAAAGFIRPANIGPGWRQAAQADASDFVRVAALSFSHLLPGHGEPIVGTAREDLLATFRADAAIRGAFS